jgi:hypothetical protein
MLLTMKIRLKVEEYIALAVIIASFFVTSPSKYFYLFNGWIVMSKHMMAFWVLFVFSILTILYKNRIQRIIDTIKSGVEIPAVTLEDQATHLWKSRYRILLVARDYLPFVLCLLAYTNLTTIVDMFGRATIDTFMLTAEQMIIGNLRNNMIVFVNQTIVFKDALAVAYNTYAISVPIFALYLHLLKRFKNFREFMLAIIIASFFSLGINCFLPSYGLTTMTTGIPKDLLGTVSLPACYTTLVLFFSLTVSPKLTFLYTPVAILLFLADSLSYSHYVISILSGALTGLISIPISKLLIRIDTWAFDRRKS